MLRLKYAVVIFALTINGGALAQSADAPNSRLNAYECEALPKPLQVYVQVLDDADRFLKFKDHFEKALRSVGAEIAPKAPIVVTLDVRTVREFQAQSKDTFLQLRAGQENVDIGREGKVFFRGNVWSSKDSSVLGGPKRRVESHLLNQLQVTANVNRRANGHCVWQGEVRHDLSGEDDDNATFRVITILANNLGKTVRNKALVVFP
jgi:hypothetical protein